MKNDMLRETGMYKQNPVGFDPLIYGFPVQRITTVLVTRQLMWPWDKLDTGNDFKGSRMGHSVKASLWCVTY